MASLPSPGTPLLPWPSFLYPLPGSRAVASGVNLVTVLLGSHSSLGGSYLPRVLLDVQRRVSASARADSG